MFNKRRNDERDKVVMTNEISQPAAEPVLAEPEIVMPDPEPSMNGNGAGKPAGNNLKPSIISEGFEFIGEIRSSGYLTIDGTV